MRSILKKPNVTFFDNGNTNNGNTNNNYNNTPAGNPLKISSDSLDHFNLSAARGQMRGQQQQQQQPSTLPYLQTSPPNYEQSFEMQPPAVRSLVDQNFSSGNAAVLSYDQKEHPFIFPSPASSSVAPTIHNSDSSSATTMPTIYNAKWKDGMLDAYRQQIGQLSGAMAQLQQQNQMSLKMEAEKSSGNSSQLQELVDGQKRMFDMYWELAKRCKHVEEVSKRQSELITSLNEMMERREREHRRQVDRLREEMYSTHKAKRKVADRDESRYYSDNTYHPSSAPTGRPFIESIDMNLKPLPRFHQSSKPPPHPHIRPSHKYPSRYDSADDYRGTRDRRSFKPDAIAPGRQRSRSPVFDSDHFSSADERAAEDSEAENDFKRDKLRTRNKLNGIENKLMELKIMTQDM